MRKTKRSILVHLLAKYPIPSLVLSNPTHPFMDWVVLLVKRGQISSGFCIVFGLRKVIFRRCIFGEGLHAARCLFNVTTFHSYSKRCIKDIVRLMVALLKGIFLAKDVNTDSVLEGKFA